MIRIGDKTFRLWSLDSNVLSEVLASRGGFRAFLVQHALSQEAVLCVSPWVIMEIRRRREFYEEFLDLFSVVPFGLLRSPDDLIQSELSHYPNPSGVSPVLGFFSPFHKDPGWRDPRKFFEKFFAQEIIQDAERRWIAEWKRSALDSMLDLKKNFPEPPQGYSGQDSVRFVELAVEQHIFFRYPDFARAKLKEANSIDTGAFPSLRMMMHTVFFRFYLERRTPEDQDVFDILIHGVAPHVDLSITEGFQADILKKVAQLDPKMDNLRGASLREARSWYKQRAT